MKKSRVDVKKIGFFKLVVLNGFFLFRLFFFDEGNEVFIRVINDERVCMGYMGYVFFLG